MGQDCQLTSDSLAMVYDAGAHEADGNGFECALQGATQAGAFWLMAVFSSYLLELKLDDWFTVLKLKTVGSKVTVTIDDGNGNVLATQEIENTDFPLSEITLYGCWDGEHWVLMLPSEY